MDDKQKPLTPIQGNINLNIDTTPVLYSDNVIWNIQEDVVILNFGQSIMGSPQIKIISRVALSKKFVSRFIGDINKNLVLTEVQGQTGKFKS